MFSKYVDLLDYNLIKHFFEEYHKKVRTRNYNNCTNYLLYRTTTIILELLIAQTFGFETKIGLMGIRIP